MAKLATALSTWRITYHETQAVAERALFDFRTAKTARPGGPFSQFWLAFLLALLNHHLAKLLSQVAILEGQPSAFLPDYSGITVPRALRELFHTTADVLQCARDESLDKTFILRRAIAHFADLHERLVGFAERSEETEQKLRGSMAAEEAEQDREAR